MLLAFLLAVYLVPVVLGGIALLTGLSARAGERRFVVCVVPAVLLVVAWAQVRSADSGSGFSVHLGACALAAVAGVLVAVGKSVVAVWRPLPPESERQARRTSSDDTRVGRSMRRAVVRTARQPRSAWATPARRLVLSRRDDTWRYAVENGTRRVVHGAVPDLGRDAQADVAQRALLAHVEHETGLRYDAAWTSARPGWWTAELTERYLQPPSSTPPGTSAAGS